MIAYIVKEMLKHVAVRLVLAVTLFLRQKRPRAEYNIRLIKQQEHEILVSAAIIGIAFGILTAWLVVMIKGNESILIVIAGILLAIGLSQQIMSIGLDTITLNMNAFISSWNSVLNLLARQHPNPQWSFIEQETNRIFIYPHIVYILPPELDQLKPSREKVIEYLDERRLEVDFLATLYHDETSLLSFAQQAAEYMRERLHIYDRLSVIQQRTGAVHPVVFIALGTLIWLLS